MVSFSCNFCNDVVTKPKVISHSRSCGGDAFSCVDCMHVFDLVTIKNHTSCMSEVAKYQGKYRCTANGNPVAKRERNPDSSDDEAKPKPPPQPRRPVPTFSDSDDEDWVKAPVKKDSSAADKKSVPAKAVPVAAPVEAKKAAQDKDGSIAVMVPSFQLGTIAEVHEIVENIFEEKHTKSVGMKELSKLVVERYQARIAKNVKAAIEDAIRGRPSVWGFDEGASVVSKKQ